jgi:hypothetical protein
MLDMKRRDFIALVGGGGLLLATNARRARAQQPGMPVVGFLRDSTAAGSEFMVNGCARDSPKQASSKVGISPSSMPGPTARASGYRRSRQN